jgi:ribosomal-protein-serine acetyltransferase
MLGIMNRPPEILTHGPVTLRRCRAADTATVTDLVLRSQPHLRPWLAWAQDYGPQDAAQFTEQCEQDWNSGAAFSYLITAGGAVVGGCALMARIGPGGLEIGYWVDAAHLRQGFATAAAAALVEAALAMPGIDRVEIVHDEANVASSGVPRKLGLAEVERRKADGPQTSGESGVDVVWRTTR